MVWNSLEDAAAWLGRVTGKEWDRLAVLDAEIKRVMASTRNGEPSLTYIKAVMPLETSYGLYKLEKGQYVRKGDASPRKTIPLALSNIYDLLLNQETRRSLASLDWDEDDLEKGIVAIDPIDKENLISIKMVGIKGEDLKSLLLFLDHEKPKQEKPLGTTERTSLLTIIAALSKEIGLPISRTSKAAGMIKDMTERIGTPVGLRTIEGHLKRINDALERRDKS
jgi:hypothetical protein